MHSPYSDYRFIPFGERLRSCYRRSMLKIGKSTNASLSSLPTEMLREREALPEARFLLFLQEYYGKLSLFERRILLCEALERGLHYRFWYVASLSDRDYRRIRKRVCEGAYLAAKKEGVW